MSGDFHVEQRPGAVTYGVLTDRGTWRDGLWRRLCGGVHVEQGSAPAATAGGDKGAAVTPSAGPRSPGEAVAEAAAVSPLALSGAYLARTLNSERVIRAVLKSGAVHDLSIEEARAWLAQLQPLVDLVDGKHEFSRHPARNRG